jgi:hypothetical protein
MLSRHLARACAALVLILSFVNVACSRPRSSSPDARASDARAHDAPATTAHVADAGVDVMSDAPMEAVFTSPNELTLSNATRLAPGEER